MQLTSFKLRRLERGKRQIQLARDTGISRTRLSLIENGWATARPAEIDRIASALGIAASDLRAAA